MIHDCSDEIDAALERVHPDWKGPCLLYALGHTDQRVWTESVLDPALCLRALWYTAPHEVKVVVLGQDVYQKPGKANGLAFGLHPDWIATGAHEKDKSSFRNIRDEMRACGYGLEDLTLESLARQGVLLLNTRLSCAPNRPMSHAGMGWEAVVREILEQLPDDVVWLTWGAEARAVAEEHGAQNVVSTSHPCRYSASRSTRAAPAFLDSRCFSAVNSMLLLSGKTPIEWGAPLEGGARLVPRGALARRSHSSIRK
jgi:uracil-DNA glycosylase